MTRNPETLFSFNLCHLFTEQAMAELKQKHGHNAMNHAVNSEQVYDFFLSASMT